MHRGNTAPDLPWTDALKGASGCNNEGKIPLGYFLGAAPKVMGERDWLSSGLAI